MTSRVTVPDGSRLNTLSLANPWTTWTGVAGLDDSCAVTLVGSPSKLWLQDWKYQNVAEGRALTMEGVKVESANMLEAAQSTGGLTLSGRLLMKNGSGWKETAPGMYSTVGAKGELTVKDSDLEFFSFVPSIDATMRFFSGSLRTSRFSTGMHSAQTNVQVRNAQLHVNADIRSVAYFPSGKDGLYDHIGVSDYSFQPTLAGGEQIALRGRTQATNNTGATVSKMNLTNDVAFYGRGTLNVGNIRVTNGRTADFDLENVEIGYRICEALANPDGTTDAPLVRFHNGVNIKMYDNRDGQSKRTPDISATVGFYGNTTIDIHDIYTGTLGKTSFNHKLRFYDRSGVEFRGGTIEYVGFCGVPVRFSRYALGDDTSIEERDYNWNVPCWRRTHAFTLGKNAIQKSATYEVVVEVAGDDIEVDPTATLIAGMQSDIKTDVWPVFCSLAKGPLGCTVQVSKEWEGASIKWVGGCAYYSTGTKDYGGATTQGRWLGAEDGLWSNANNWGGALKPYSGIDATFNGETRTVVTNDTANAQALKLACMGGAPFILRGNKIKTFRTGLGPDAAIAVFSQSPFPFIVECPLEANGDFGCNSQYSDSKAQGMVALMGAVDASQGKFGPSGCIVVGNTLDCRELVFQTAKFNTPYSYGDPGWSWVKKNFTELIVLKGGTINVSAQETANTVTGGLWIDKGGTVNVTGAWNWNTSTNEHQVNGLLDLSAATVGGDAAQGYFGTGRVRIGTTDGTADVKLGEGITLETTAANWGTMPIEMTSGFTISNKTDWTYAVPGGIRVTGPGHALTVYVAKDTVTTIETGVDGYDFDIVKLGEGKLVLNGNVDGLKRGTLDIRGGTVAFDGALKVRTIVSAPGTTLAFGSTNGVTASLFVDDDVDLSNLTFRSAAGDNPAQTGYQTVVTVPWDCEFAGAPTVDGVKLRTVANADGSKSLQAKATRGLLLLFR